MIKVAIVDDSDLIRKSLSVLLEELAEVNVCWQADTAAGALKMLDDCSPDFIILDIFMPGKSGIEIISDIKARTKSKIIIYTLYPYPEYRKFCNNAGVDYFVDKADSFQNVINIIRGVNL